MKFHFEKLGLIDEADLELADLTIICGENNTGKTYATYAIYGFLRCWRDMLFPVLAPRLREIAQTSDTYQLDLQDIFAGKLNDYLDLFAKQYVKRLPEVFAANKTYFDGAAFCVAIDGERDFAKTDYQNTIKDGKFGKVLATLRKEAGSTVLDVLMASDAPLFLRDGGLINFVADAIGDIVFAPYLPDTFIASAERTGAAIFCKEPDFARTRMIEVFSTLNPLGRMQRMESGYAWPVKDNIDFVRTLEELDKQTGLLASANPDIIDAFNAIIGGSYKVIKNKGLIYQPKGGGKARFSMNESSSSLSDLGSSAAKPPGRPIFHRLFGQYLDIDTANPAKSGLARLIFRFRRPKSDRLLAACGLCLILVFTYAAGPNPVIYLLLTNQRSICTQKTSVPWRG